MSNIVIITIEQCCNHLKSVYPSVEAFEKGMVHDDSDQALFFEISDGELELVNQLCPSDMKQLRSQLQAEEDNLAVQMFGTPDPLNTPMAQMFADAIKYDGEQIAEEIYKFLSDGN